MSLYMMHTHANVFFFFFFFWVIHMLMLYVCNSTIHCLTKPLSTLQNTRGGHYGPPQYNSLFQFCFFFCLGSNTIHLSFSFSISSILNIFNTIQYPRSQSHRHTHRLYCLVHLPHPTNVSAAPLNGTVLINNTGPHFKMSSADTWTYPATATSDYYSHPGIAKQTHCPWHPCN